MAAGLIGCIEPFDASANDGETYVARLEQYLDTNSIQDKKEAVMLLMPIGGTTYQLVRNLVAPADPKAKSFDELTAVLNQHFAPAPLAISGRYFTSKTKCQAKGWLLRSQNFAVWRTTVTSVGTSTFPSAITSFVD